MVISAVILELVIYYLAQLWAIINFSLRGLRENLKHKIRTLEVIGITIGNDQVHKNELEVKTKNGYKVIAPIGSSFCCYDPGMFEPKKGEASEEQMNNAYSVGLTFPKMQLQVFKLSRYHSYITSAQNLI